MSKPAPYIKIKRNVYLIKKKIEKDDGILCFCTASPGSLGVCGKTCECRDLHASCSKNCKCGSSCLNKPFQQCHIKKLKVVQTENCGFGIVAEEDIKLGDFIIEYVGEVIDGKICDERIWAMSDRGDANLYMCEISRDMVIDATYKGNKSRFINHSCCPNTDMMKWTIDGEKRLGIFAIRDIQKGEHLTYDYQLVLFGADQDCHCGAVNCRGKLGVTHSKRKMSSDACQVYRNGGLQIGVFDIVDQSKCLHICIVEVIRIKHLENVRFGIIKRFDKYSQKHSIIFEDGCVEIYDFSKENWELVRL